MNLSYSEYKAIVEFSPNMIWRSGTDANCNYFNETWLKFTGKKLEDEVGEGWTNGVHPEDYERCLKTYLEFFELQLPFEMEYRLSRFDGEWRWINDRGAPFFDSLGNFAGYIGSCIDVTEKIEGRRLTEMAHTDGLTGLYNRNYLDWLSEYEFRRTLQEKANLVVMMSDIDKFKYFNDNFGHSFGDMVLKRVAQAIAGCIRNGDIAGRFGGDEFLIVLPGAKQAEAQIIAERILHSIHRITVGDTTLDISLSIGIAGRQDEEELNRLIENADWAMYQAKQKGGNRFCIF